MKLKTVYVVMIFLVFSSCNQIQKREKVQEQPQEKLK